MPGYEKPTRDEIGIVFPELEKPLSVLDTIRERLQGPRVSVCGGALETYRRSDKSPPRSEYYPDLGPVPIVTGESLIQVGSIDLRLLPDRAVFGWYPMDSEGVLKGHLDSTFSAQVVDTPAGRFLRFWRTPLSSLKSLEGRQEAAGQGLFVDFDTFTISRTGENPHILKEGEAFVMPYFREGEGPKGWIQYPDLGEDGGYFTTAASLYVELNKNT